MPVTKSAKKRLRQNEKRRLRNKALRSQIRTRTRRFLEMDSPEEAREELNELYALLDRAAGKNVIHSNKAARKKSQLAKHLDSLSG